MAVVSITSTYVEFGPCQVTFGGTDLGAFQGGVTFTYEVGYVDVPCDQLSTLLTSFVQTETCMATVPMIELDLAVLTNVMPTGAYTLDGTKKKILVGGGQLASGDFQQLIITPTTDGSATISTDANTKVTIHEALAKIQFTKSYNLEGVIVIPVEFHGYADTTRSAGDQLFLLGDSSAT